MDKEHSPNADRLEYLYLNLVGEIVQVHTVDGAILEGIFASRTDPETPDEEAGVIIDCTRSLRSQVHSALDPTNFSPATKLILYNDIIMMEATRVKVRTETPGAGIVHSYRGAHDLATLDWADEGGGETLEEEPHETGKWDQFAANERLGIQASTYTETKYTTKLDLSTVPKETSEWADRVAQQIEQSTTRNIQHRVERGGVDLDDIDEGQLFSDVAREPPKRFAQAAPRRGETKAAPGKRREEGAPSPVEAKGQDFNPNPAAAPFIPSRPIINDYLKIIAEAICRSPECYGCAADWPGEEDHYEREGHHHTYPLQQPQQQQQQQQQPLPQPQQHHHHHLAAPPPNQPGGFSGHSGMHGGVNQYNSNNRPIPSHSMPPHAMAHHQHAGQFGNHAGGQIPHYHMGNPHHIQAPPLPQQHQQHMDPSNNVMNTGVPGPSTSRQPPQRQKGSQPQQPVSSSLPNNAPTIAVPAVDSFSAQETKQPGKKLRRGGGGSTMQRGDGGDGSSLGKRGAK